MDILQTAQQSLLQFVISTGWRLEEIQQELFGIQTS